MLSQAGAFINRQMVVIRGRSSNKACLPDCGAKAIWLYQQPMIVDQINYLYRMLDRADQKPGRDAYLRFDELTEAVAQCHREIDLVLGRV